MAGIDEITTRDDNKHSKYSELDRILDLFNGVGASHHANRPFARAELVAYITKEKAKAELAARFKYEPAIAHAIGYCRGLGHPESYLEKQFPELAQLAKDKEDGNG